jgi:hypothetical protein
MEKLKTLISELENIYNIFSLNKKEADLIDKELSKSTNSKIIWLKEYIEFVLKELDE